MLADDTVERLMTDTAVKSKDGLIASCPVHVGVW